jgi:hypothetical protein
VTRNSRVLPITAFVLAVVGLALLVIEVVRVVGGSALGTVGEVLLWVGVAFVVVAVALMTTMLLGAQPEAAADGTADGTAGREADPVV